MNDVKMQTRQLSVNKWSYVKKQKVDICYLALKIPFTAKQNWANLWTGKKEKETEKEKEIN